MVSTFKIAKKLITGEGSLSVLARELKVLGIKNPVILTDKIINDLGVATMVGALLDQPEIPIYDRILPEPEYGVVEECAKYVLENKYDGLIALGGGSVIDTAKVVSFYTTYDGDLDDLVGSDLVPFKGLPLIAIPTTSGTGSEVTNVAVLSDTKNQVKKGIASDYLLPDVAIVAPEMMLTMPKSVTAASGIDALIHAVESYISIHASEITESLALKAISMISENLRTAYNEPHNLFAREKMATASLMAGMAFGNSGLGAVHALALPLGGRHHIAHGISTALLLISVMKWNKNSCLEKMRDIAQAFNIDVTDKSASEAADLAINAMELLCNDVGIKLGLSEYGIPKIDLSIMASEAIKIERILKNNPRKLSVQDLENIYLDAY